jgi:ATP-dependent protease Clp ATPase subunit
MPSSRCSFCGRPPTHGRKIVARPDGLFICDDCVDLVLETLSDPTFEPALSRDPRRLVSDVERARTLLLLREALGKGG